ncbi:MAG: DUF2194 domain-containing protein [Spirochaetaceae bacterium]|nr:MAG: DUF2194 domain-containing protein [Spirochaetaceae bacterium]
MRWRVRLLGMILLVLLVIPVQGALSLSFQREILALYKSSEGQTERENEIFFYLSRPLKQMGFTVRYWDIDKGVPDSRSLDRVRAVISWYRGAAMSHPEQYLEFLESAMDREVKVLVFDNFGAYQDRDSKKYMEPSRLNPTLARLGIMYFGDWTQDAAVMSIVTIDSRMVEYQGTQDLQNSAFFYRFLQHDRNLKVYLSIRRTDRNYDPSPVIVTNRNGGFALSRYIYRQESGKVKLLLNVEEFLKESLFPRAEQERIALLSESSDTVTAKTLEYTKTLLRRAKLPFQVIDKEQLSLLVPGDLRPFSAVGLILKGDSDLDPKVLEDFLDQGGGVVSLVGGDFQKLASVLGQTRGRGRPTAKTGYRFKEGFLLGEGLPLEGTTFQWLPGSGSPATDAEILAYSHKESHPLLWTVARGDGRVLSWNWNGFLTGDFQGFILESFLYVRPVGIAATAGLGIMFVDDWPIPMFNVVKAPLSVKDTEFYTRQFWPDMKAFFSRRGIPYISYLVFNYNANTEPPFGSGEFFVAENQATVKIAREILESGQELGLHGYNHISLTENKTKVNVAVWPSQQAMEQSLEAARKEWIGLFGEHSLPYAYIAPNNIISEKGIAAVHNAFPSIKVMSFLRSGMGEETRTDFGPHPRFRDVYLIPRTSSGYPFTPAVRQLTVAAASGAGIWAHFIHADDIFDPHRSQGMSWEQLKDEFGSMVDFVNKHYPWIRFVSLREAHETLRRHDDIGMEYRWLDGERLEIRSTSPGLPLRIRMNGYQLRHSDGAKILYRYSKMPAIVLEMEGTLATLEFSKR